MTSPTRARVAPTAFRFSALSRSAKSRAIPAPRKARVTIINASSDRLSFTSPTMVLIVEFAAASNGGMPIRPSASRLRCFVSGLNRIARTFWLEFQGETNRGFLSQALKPDQVGRDILGNHSGIDPQSGESTLGGNQRMYPVYYFVRIHRAHREPKKRVSFEVLIQIPTTLSEGAPSAAYERLATDAAKSVLRRSLNLHSQWSIYASRFEGPEIPRATPKIAENGCRVWILRSP